MGSTPISRSIVGASSVSLAPAFFIKSRRCARSTAPLLPKKVCEANFFGGPVFLQVPYRFVGTSSVSFEMTFYKSHLSLAPLFLLSTQNFCFANLLRGFSFLFARLKNSLFRQAIVAAFLFLCKRRSPLALPRFLFPKSFAAQFLQMRLAYRTKNRRLFCAVCQTKFARQGLTAQSTSSIITFDTV